MNTTEMKMLRWIQGKTRKLPHQKCYHPGKGAYKTNKHFLMKKRLSWFGHVQRRDEDNIAKSVLNTRRIDGSCPRGRPKLRWMDRLKDDMKKNNIIVLHLYHVLASLTDDVCADALWNFYLQ